MMEATGNNVSSAPGGMYANLWRSDKDYYHDEAFIALFFSARILWFLAILLASRCHRVLAVCCEPEGRGSP
jgi:hypothetical protein